MPPYQVACCGPDCKHPAAYKIAARWSDGVVRELKTYGLCCDAHLADGFRRALAKQQACHLTAGETLDPPGIYRLHRGQRDQTLERLTELEQRLIGPPP
jgi:hypothetical protein